MKRLLFLLGVALACNGTGGLPGKPGALGAVGAIGSPGSLGATGPISRPLGLGGKLYRDPDDLDDLLSTPEWVCEWVVDGRFLTDSRKQFICGGDTNIEARADPRVHCFDTWPSNKGGPHPYLVVVKIDDHEIFYRPKYAYSAIPIFVNCAEFNPVCYLPKDAVVKIQIEHEASPGVRVDCVPAETQFEVDLGCIR